MGQDRWRIRRGRRKWREWKDKVIGERLEKEKVNKCKEKWEEIERKKDRKNFKVKFK